MKKVLFIILGLLFTLSAFAVGYAAPYKGSTRSGYMHMTSSARVHSVGGGGVGGFVQPPATSMRSTSTMCPIVRTSPSNSTQSIAVVQGIRTSASQIFGGITTYDEPAPICKRGRRFAPLSPPAPGDEGYCSGCDGHYVWDESEGDYYCTECGHYLMDGCDCNPCHCPIAFDWQVVLFLFALMCAYVIYKETKKSRA